MVGFDEIVESRLSRLPGCKFYSGPGGEKVFMGVDLSSRSRWEAAEGGKGAKRCQRSESEQKKEEVQISKLKMRVLLSKRNVGKEKTSTKRTS